MSHGVLDAAVAAQCVATWGARLRSEWEVAAMVREHPGVFLDPVGISAFTGFVLGFSLRASFDPPGAGDLPPWPRFVEWLAARQGRRDVPGLATLMLAEADGDDARALTALWAHLDAWRASPPAVTATCAPTTWRAPGRPPPARLELWTASDGASWLCGRPGGEIGPLRPSAEIVRRYAEMALGVDATSWQLTAG